MTAKAFDFGKAKDPELACRLANLISQGIARVEQAALGTQSKQERFPVPTSPKDAADRCREGNKQYKREAEELLAKLETEFEGRQREQFNPQVFGAYPIVPDFLAGDPMSMRHKELVEHPLAPIRIYVEVVCSAGCSQSEIASRGLALAALAHAMSDERAVELWAFGGMKTGRVSCIPCVRIPTNPSDLTVLLSTFATTSFCRGVMFVEHWDECGASQSRKIDWALGYYGDDSRQRKHRLALEAAPQDIMVMGGHLMDANLFDRDPVAWLNKQLADQRKRDDFEEAHS